MSSTAPTNFPRRRFLGYGGAGAAAVLLGTGTWSASTTAAMPRKSPDPFTLGVASGDPSATGVALWTRLAPDPFAADGRGGMDRKPVRVHYQVACDEHFRRVVCRGSVVAVPELDHAVHPELEGLEPNRCYWYRFRAGPHLSEVGRTKTTPDGRTMPRSLRFAFVSCQAWQDGYFTAYDHLACEDLDLVVHLGDYIYESGLKSNKRNIVLPSQFDGEAFDLGRYRLQYSLYKSERPLQRAHAAFPWLQTMDDHEVENNWAGDHSQPDREPDQDPVVFRRRRAAAFQAMYENLPFRCAQLPSGPDVRLHRRIRYGRLADFTMLDTRQYRDRQPCGGGGSADCSDRFGADRTMLGGKQKEWLLDGFSCSPARWQILGNQVTMAQTDRDPSPSRTYVWLDPWDGYVAERNEVLAEAEERGVRNLVVITGDRHTNYAVDLKRDYADPGSSTVGAEFVGTSITSGGDGADMNDQGRAFLAANPHLKFFNFQRGYSRMTVTPQQCRNDFRVVPFVLQQGAPVSTRASFVVQDRIPGVQLDYPSLD
ncbi:MAG: alkaline phosphatase [Propionibacteriaceae bacterium]|nr:Alkaline phosphatase [Propionibacteriaceae bacterium]MDX6321818.1 alkaline phosphatase [Propionibacteriaceae bacterium]